MTEEPNIELRLYGMSFDLGKEETKAIREGIRRRIITLLKEGEFDYIIKDRIVAYNEYYKKHLTPIVKEILSDLDMSVRFDAYD